MKQQNLITTDEQPATAPKRISRKVRAAIEAMVRANGCKTVTDAAAEAGLSREHLSRELGKPHIAEHMHQRIKRSLAVASARAGAVKVELLESDNAMVRDRASSFVLGLAGIKPDSAPPVAGGQSPGVVIQIMAAPAGPLSGGAGSLITVEPADRSEAIPVDF